jgi:hypothetical protein
VEAAFDGGLVTWDAGALLLGATDRAIQRRSAAVAEKVRSVRWLRTFLRLNIFMVGSGGDNLNVIRSYCTKSYPEFDMLTRKLLHESATPGPAANLNHRGSAGFCANIAGDLNSIGIVSWGILPRSKVPSTRFDDFGHIAAPPL